MIKYFQTLDWLKLAKLLKILIIVYIGLVFSICLFKYFTFNYTGLDLAIFNQVFYHSSLGNLFNFTIHPTSYLGDHFTPVLLFLLPVYFVFRSPLTLLFIQAIFLGLASIPLYLIAKKHLQPKQTLFILILYLFNPLTLNIALFEFHLLPLIPFFILWTFYFYITDKFKPFILLAILSLLIREDVSFIIFMFGIIALLDRKKTKWVLTPIIISCLYFFTALKIVGHFAAASTYKFLVYYQWLGDSVPDIILNFFPKFHLVLLHVFDLANFELVLGLLLVFIFIPLFRPKYLLLCLGMFMQIILGFASGELILRTHYSSIFLTSLIIATIFALKALFTNPKFLKIYKKNKDLILLLVFTALIYNFLVLGPVPSFIKNIFINDYQQTSLKNEFVKQIPNNEPVIASYDFIAYVSSREKLYSLNYVYLGRQQYNAGEYIVPEDTPYLLVNFNDFVTFHLQYSQKADNYYYSGDNNMLALLQEKNYGLKSVKQNMALWQKDWPGEENQLYQIFDQAPQISQSRDIAISDQFKFLGYDKENEKLSFYFETLTETDENYFIVLNEQIYPLGYGLYPTSEWQEKKVIKINFYNLSPVDNFEIIKITGGLELNGIGNIRHVFDDYNIIGQANLN
ncbi:DUF2079 domain-containing protein [Patescibacteria group bacterium]